MTWQVPIVVMGVIALPRDSLVEVEAIALTSRCGSSCPISYKLAPPCEHTDASDSKKNIPQGRCVGEAANNDRVNIASWPFWMASWNKTAMKRLDVPAIMASKEVVVNVTELSCCSRGHYYAGFLAVTAHNNSVRRGCWDAIEKFKYGLLSSGMTAQNIKFMRYEIRYSLFESLKKSLVL